jgi:hypothetical protein
MPEIAERRDKVTISKRHAVNGAPSMNFLGERE